MGKHFPVDQSHREMPSLILAPGDILIFKRNTNNRTVKTLSWALQRLESDWDRWGWHTGYVSKVLPDGTIETVEALIGKGVQIIKYPDSESLGDVRVYRWLDESNLYALEDFTKEHIGLQYDLACYLWTSIQRILLQFSGHPIHRKINNKFTCWELVCAMARAMEKPLQPINRYPLITDMEKVLESARLL